MSAAKVLVTCPACGHTQREPAAAFSTACKKCRQYFRVQEVLQSSAPPPEPAPRRKRRAMRHVACFKCGTDLEVAPAAQSTMCKRCSSHVDLRDYQITNAVSKNFKTKGRFVIEDGGFLFNTDSVAGDVVLKGRFLGKLRAENSLEIHRTGEIKGSFTTGNLIIPNGTTFSWPEPIQLGSANISGELTADIRAAGTVSIRSTARFFGTIEAGGLAVESGAVVVGNVRIRPSTAPTKAAGEWNSASPTASGRP